MIRRVTVLIRSVLVGLRIAIMGMAVMVVGIEPSGDDGIVHAVDHGEG